VRDHPCINSREEVIVFKVSAPVFCALFICIALDIAPMAHASPESKTVRIGDLNRHSEAGAHELLRRIERAASEVCGQSFARRYMAARRTYRECRDTTILATVDRLGDERLNEAYVTRYGAF
jgi:UrcA family protein